MSQNVYVHDCRINLKLHHISIKKVVTNPDLSKASDPDCIPVVVLEKYEPELSYIIAKIFNMFLKESYFSDCWKV